MGKPDCSSYFDIAKKDPNVLDYELKLMSGQADCAMGRVWGINRNDKNEGEEK